LAIALTSVLWQQPQWRATPSPSGAFELSQNRRQASSADGDSGRSHLPLYDAALPLCSSVTDNAPTQHPLRTQKSHATSSGGLVSRNPDTLTGDLKLAGFGGDKRAVPTRPYSSQSVCITPIRGRHSRRSLRERNESRVIIRLQPLVGGSTPLRYCSSNTYFSSAKARNQRGKLKAGERRFAPLTHHCGTPNAIRRECGTSA